MIAGMLLYSGITRAQETSVPTSSSSTVSYQGILADNGGKLSDGTYDLTVTLYSDPEGHNYVWRDDYSTTITNGLFNVSLGSGTMPLPKAAIMDKPLWVGVSVNGGAELRPLVALSAVPMALNVADNAITAKKMGTDFVGAITLDGKNITGKGNTLNLHSGGGIDLKYDEFSNSLNITTSSDISNGKKQTHVPGFDYWGEGGNQLAGGEFLGSVTGFAQTGVDIRVDNGGGNPASGRVMWYDIVGGNSPIIIGGYLGNTITANDGSTIAGGGQNGAVNNISSDYGFIGSGDNNSINGGANYSVISGGQGNLVLNDHSVIGGGLNNQAGGGAGLTMTVGGGEANIAFDDGTTVAGGEGNHAMLIHSFIGGGRGNSALGHASVVGGGESNTANNDFDIVVGGQGNQAFNNNTFVGGGQGNQATRDYSAIVGGQGNRTLNDYSFIGGGHNNTAGGAGGVTMTIGGGENNIAADDGSTVAGGENNHAMIIHSFIGGGFGNTTTGPQSVVSGGLMNQATAPEATVGGGNTNQATGDQSVVAGGLNNVAGGSGITQSVGGGEANLAFGDGTTIAGGEHNTSWLKHSAILGGYMNTTGTAALAAAIGGGQFNRAIGSLSTIPGGDHLTAQMNDQTVVGMYNTPLGTWTGGPLTDDPIFLVGNGSGAGTSNAFQVSLNGHALPYQVLGNFSAAPPNPPVKGASYNDNAINAWGDVNVAGLVLNDFGVIGVANGPVGTYTVTLNYPAGTLPNAAIVVTVNEDPCAGGVPGFATVQHIGSCGLLPTQFVVRTYTVGFGGAVATNLPFHFHVAGR